MSHLFFSHLLFFHIFFSFLLPTPHATRWLHVFSLPRLQGTDFPEQHLSDLIIMEIPSNNYQYKEISSGELKQIQQSDHTAASLPRLRNRQITPISPRRPSSTSDPTRPNMQTSSHRAHIDAASSRSEPAHAQLLIRSESAHHKTSPCVSSRQTTERYSPFVDPTKHPTRSKPHGSAWRKETCFDLDLDEIGM